MSISIDKTPAVPTAGEAANLAYDQRHMLSDPRHLEWRDEVCTMLLALSADRATEAVAAWMIAHGYATGHGDTLDDLLNELVANDISLRDLEPHIETILAMDDPERVRISVKERAALTACFTCIKGKLLDLKRQGRIP